MLSRLQSRLAEAPLPSGPRVDSPRWDGKSEPAHLARIRERFGLLPEELAVLSRQGFVALDRQTFSSYALAFHELYQSELPIYVSVDSVLHAVFLSHEQFIEQWEQRKVAPALERVLFALVRALPQQRPLLPPEVAEDLAVYLDVARALLTGTNGTRGDTAVLVKLATAAASLSQVTLFGRERMIDFSQFLPRGHYVKNKRLEHFFRAAMWLSRLEFNLLSRSSRSSEPGAAPNPAETPREAVAALALAELAEKAGVLDTIAEIEHGWGALSGVREDVPLSELYAIRKTLPDRLSVSNSFIALKAAIGDRFRRTARTHYMPQGSTDLPVIATLLGPRVTSDTAAMRLLTHSEVPERYELHAGDLAVLLGHEHGKRLLAPDLARFSKLGAALESGRTVAQAKRPGANDLYSGWFDMVAALSRPAAGTVPSFMQTDAFADLRLDEALVAYGELRHTYVLLAGQAYEEGGCTIPDGWVDPALAVWEGLIAFADRADAAFASLDPKDTVGARAYYQRLKILAKVLRTISREELTGRPLSSDALAFLSKIVEIAATDEGTGYYTHYNGWYFDLFPMRPESSMHAQPRTSSHAAMLDASFVADYYTSTNTGRVAYVGGKAPRLAIFVVDTSGPPRIMVGPIAHGFAAHEPLSARLTDKDVPKLGSRAESPWSRSYVVPARPEPRLTLSIQDVPNPICYRETESQNGKSCALDVTLRSPDTLGDVLVTLYDHHRRPVAKKTVNVPAGKLVHVRFPARAQRIQPGTHAAEMISITVGDIQVYRDIFGETSYALGGLSLPK